MRYETKVNELHIEKDRVSLKFTNNWGYGDYVFMTVPEWKEIGEPKPNDIIIFNIYTKEQ